MTFRNFEARFPAGHHERERERAKKVLDKFGVSWSQGLATSSGHGENLVTNVLGNFQRTLSTFWSELDFGGVDTLAGELMRADSCQLMAF